MVIQLLYQTNNDTHHLIIRKHDEPISKSFGYSTKRILVKLYLIIRGLPILFR